MNGSSAAGPIAIILPVIDAAVTLAGIVAHNVGRRSHHALRTRGSSPNSTGEASLLPVAGPIASVPAPYKLSTPDRKQAVTDPHYGLFP